MKDLLKKLVKMPVSICFKSGHKINCTVIEAIIGNSIVASDGEKITTIEIPHIAYVTIKEDNVKVLEVLLNNQQNNDSDKKDNNDNNDKKDDGKNNHKDDNGRDNSKCSSRDNKKCHKCSFEY